MLAVNLYFESGKRTIHSSENKKRISLHYQNNELHQNMYQFSINQRNYLKKHFICHQNDKINIRQLRVIVFATLQLFVEYTNHSQKL